MRYIKTAMILITTFLIAMVIWESRGPDRILEFERSVIVPKSPENDPNQDWTEIRDRVFNLKRWPEWHHEMVSSKQNPDQTITMHLKLKGFKNVYLTWEVIEWKPDYGFRLRLKQDSSEKLLKAFQWVETSVYLKKEDGGVKIIGSARAKTRSARIRFFSRFSERILMNQVFYPDLASFQFHRMKTYTPPGI
jgi:hypothetical protein